MDWSKLPDVIAVGLLAWAFVSVARHNHEPISHHWLTGWFLIVLHFVGLVFLPSPGAWGLMAGLVAILGLVWAGVFFMRASVPYRQELSSQIMLYLLLAAYGIFTCAIEFDGPRWLFTTALALIGIGPIAVAFCFLRQFNHPLRWVIVSTNTALAVFLLFTSHGSDFPDVAMNALLFSVYLSCAIHFVYMVRRASAGGLISTTGFFLWAMVFAVAPSLQAHFPNLHLESEVWNLPKYIVAIGMILLMFEEQIAHNKHLALHDELTGLPNRRLFQDRLASALERARRTKTKAALLMIDLDEFKQVNDTLGHHAGDMLLRSVAQLINGRLRRSDTVARTGGDEFAVILDCPTSHPEAIHVGQVLLERLREPVRLKDGPLITVGASLGVAVFPDDAQDMEALCIAADLRMYAHKRAHNSAEQSLAIPREPAHSKPQKEHGLGLPQ